MNFVFIAPHFPHNFENFIVRLKENGVRVLGIADVPYDSLSLALKENLTEYYRVNSLEEYESVLRACGYYVHKYGKIDRIESHNEHWLNLDAKLRTDFNVPGLKVDDMSRLQRKSHMKEVFRSCNIAVAKGRVIKDLDDALKLAKTLKYPVLVKPDIGVGAEDTHKINNEDELRAFYEQKADYDYIMEEFIKGNIVSYDGLSDQSGKTVFTSTLQYNKAVLEITDNDEDLYYCIPRSIPRKLRTIGEKCVKAFGIKERFFHFEFFINDETGEYIGLEVNARPPGGATTDMWNYANDMDIYKEYANIVAFNTFEKIVTRPYHCCYIGRKDRDYQYSIDEIREKYGHHLSDVLSVPGIFSQIMGHYGFIVRAENKAHINKIIKDIALERK